MNEYTKAVLKKHPDALAIAQSDDFKGWIVRQPPRVAHAVYGDADGRFGTVAEVIQILHDYKAAVGLGRTWPAQPRFTRAQIREMSLVEFAEREGEIDKALAKGLIR